jgi:SUN domain-containing protein 1/2
MFPQGVELSRVLSEVEGLETRLAEMWNQSQSTFITEAIALQMVQLQIQQQLNSAKREWLKLVPQEMSSVMESVDSLKEELSARDNQLSEKLLALEKLVEDNNTTVTESLLQLILELQAASASISDLTKGADSQASQLASLKSEVARLKSVGEEERMEVVGRLEALEGARLGREDLATAFQEEMEKSVGSDTSVLWLWLSQELEKAGEERAVSTSGLTRKEVEQLIRTALATYSADRIAKFDFALENSGGVVVSSSDTYPPALETYHLMGVPLWTVPSSPKAIIQPGVYPGDCWAMKGVKGYALIRLKEAVVVTGVTVEHIPKDLTPSGSLSSAPREFRILGKNETEPVHEGETLGKFTYTIDGSPIQEFSVRDEGKAYTHILFDFLSNHGNELYTCVYRVRVHGRRVSPT